MKCEPGFKPLLSQMKRVPLRRGDVRGWHRRGRDGAGLFRNRRRRPARRHADVAAEDGEDVRWGGAR
jgi:hypothetical protein